MTLSQKLDDILARYCLKEYCELFLKQYQEQIDEYFEAYKALHQGAFDGIMLKLESQQENRQNNLKKVDLKYQTQRDCRSKFSSELSFLIIKIKQLRPFQIKSFAALREKRKEDNFKYEFYVEYMELYRQMIPHYTCEILLKSSIEILKKEIRALQEQL